MVLKSRSRNRSRSRKRSVRRMSRRRRTTNIMEKYEKAYQDCLKKVKVKKSKSRRQKSDEPKNQEDCEDAKKNLTEYNVFISKNIKKMKGSNQAQRLKAAAKKWNKMKKEKTEKRPRGRPPKNKKE